MRHAISSLMLAVSLAAAPVCAQTIVDDWGNVKAPAAPELKTVKVDPGTTALLMLDLGANCPRRPRCMASLPKLKALLATARAKGMPVIHSFTPTGTAAEVMADVAVAADEPTVAASVNKFHGTALEKILKDKGVKTVIVVGTLSEGAVLNTATHAAVLGMNVIVPVDGMSSASTYPEQYTAWHLVNAPGVGPRTTLTKIENIAF